MKVKNIFLLIVSIIILIANASFTEALTLKVDPSEKVLPDVGTTFEITIKIEEASAIQGGYIPCFFSRNISQIFIWNFLLNLYSFLQSTPACHIHFYSSSYTEWIHGLYTCWR